jgi:hypothetical protein
VFFLNLLLTLSSGCQYKLIKFLRVLHLWYWLTCTSNLDMIILEKLQAIQFAVLKSLYFTPKHLLLNFPAYILKCLKFWVRVRQVEVVGGEVNYVTCATLNPIRSRCWKKFCSTLKKVRDRLYSCRNMNLAASQIVCHRQDPAKAPHICSIINHSVSDRHKWVILACSASFAWATDWQGRRKWVLGIGRITWRSLQ